MSLRSNRRPRGASVVFLVASAAWALACAGGEADKDAPGLFDDHDVDDDGYVYADDCDDDNAAVNPGAREVCDPHDVDEDCDGRADSLDDDADGRIGVHHDADGDGFGAAEETLLCEVVDGYLTDDRDCDDADAAVHPDAQEVCGGGDEDCDGAVDDEDDDVSPEGFVDRWEDLDGDGFGGAPTAAGCAVGDGQADDDDDCDDGDAGTNPAAYEACGGADEDCDGEIDENDALDVATWYADADGDGFGDVARAREACTAPRDHVADASDCDDSDEDVFPGAVEVCDDVDEDCDGAVDDAAVDAATWYADADGDGYGSAADTRESCDAPAGYVARGTDCDDAAAGTNPGASERCDAADTDEDCDGLADDMDPSAGLSGRTPVYVDEDGDGYGDPAVTYAACDLLPGFSTDATDCDDTSASAHPGGVEVCDAANVDEDCDGAADDADAGVATASMSTFYPDADGDGFGGPGASVTRCDAPSGYGTTDTDCDDADPARSPGRTEVCDAADVDEDCDGLADDADGSVSSAGRTRYYADRDGDGYGDGDAAASRCDPASGYVTDDEDCDDGDVAIYPGAPEVCFDDVDDDCDGGAFCELGLADADRALYGDSRWTLAGAGSSVASAGDLDGDGIDDLLVGAYLDPEVGTYAGKAYVVLGAGAGTSLRTDAHATYRAERSSAYAGYGLAGPGDLSGDGIADVVVGAMGDTDGGAGAGAAFVYSGDTTGRVQLSTASAWAQLVGESAGDGAGFSLAKAGDVDGDGEVDLLVGALGHGGSYTGAAYLVTSVHAGVNDLSAAAALRTGESASDYAGVAVSGAGDTDGDGYDDVVIGAYADDDGGAEAGAVYLVLGPFSGTASLATADAKLRGAARDDFAGQAVSGGGDVDGDGYDDLLIGARQYGSYGAAHLVLGPVTGAVSLSTADARIEGEAGLFGSSVAVDGDMDGDGFADLAIGNLTERSLAGSASVFLGPVSGVLSVDDADVYIAGAAGDYVGAAVAYVGSQAGVAGVSDLLVGVSGDDTATGGAGAAYIFSASGF